MAAGRLFICFLLFCLAKATTVFSQSDSLDQRIILIGDAGEQHNGVHPEIEMIKKKFPLDKRTTVIYLGDNIYPQGLPSRYAKNYPEKKQILDSQINIVRGTQAKAYFIAGNHDWMQGRRNGYRQVINQYHYISSLQRPNVRYVPSDACPGPEEIRISDKITLVVIDSQWWLHKYDKPGVGSGCEANTEAELLSVLQEIMDRNEEKLLIFASHHPFVTFGRHGGYYNLKQHIFPFTDLNPKLFIPLPVIGSIYPVARGVFGNIQDTKHPIYKNFARGVDSILSRHPNCIRVAGHEHNLQLIEQKDHYYVVSGAGSKESEITKDDDLLYSSIGTGFATIDVIRNGHVYVKFYSSEKDSTGKPLFEKPLSSIDSSHIPKKPFKIPVFPDSVVVVAAQYYKAGKLKKWLLGSNYRDEWTQPVKVRVFDIGKEKGGLKVIKKGGGLQTKSLTLQDAAGREYALRSVEKFPDATLPEEFRQTIIKDAVVDGISASYPYAALSLPALSKAADVPYVVPKLVYLPDDPRLGYYQAEFGNTLCIFEEREPARYGENKSTEKIIESIQANPDNRIDQKAVLKARLLDMFIMDFDRHDDQWRWNIRDTGRGKFYDPLPRDHDQAFFVNEGQIPKRVSKPWRLPKFQGFRPKAIDIRTFNYNARYFDRTFLNAMTMDDWKRESELLVEEMTDSVIETALKKQPPEVYKYSAKKIIQKLEDRRKYLPDEALQYYKFISKEVDIPGTNESELFEVQRQDSGVIDVNVRLLDKNRQAGDTLYSRKFYSGETKEIRLFGLDGNDSFHITGNNNRSIKLRVIGGEGRDYFINESNALKKNTVIYDYRGDNDQFAGDGAVKKEISGNPSINIYNRKTFRYDLIHPKASFAYNRDDGLFLGAALRYTEHGFNKDPYKLLHEITAQYALLTRAYRFSYNFVAVDAVGSSDIVVHADIRAPNNTINFFGMGNNTVNGIKDNVDFRFYRSSMVQGDLAVLLKKEIAPDINILYGPTFQAFNVDSLKNRGRLVSFPSVTGIDSSFLYRRRTYAGFAGALVIDNRNDLNYPTRGIKWKTALQMNKGVNSYSSNFTQFTSDLSVYISSNLPPRMVIALRFGGGINFGSYEFYQAQFLSGTENLRGYRKYRFAGDKMFYNNLDIRIRLKDYQGYLFTGSYGLLFFHDVGRVWWKGEESGRWHNGYGLGAWVSPAKRFVVAASYMRSKEGGLPLVNFGFQF